MFRYPSLFSPLLINKLYLRNRIVMSAMHLNYTPYGKVNDKLISFYTERAIGGVGLIIVGGCVINKLSGGPIFISIKEDEDIEGLSRLAQAVHTYGGAIGVQLYMAGAYAHPMLIGQEPISSSTHFSNYTKAQARGMTINEIDQVQNDFVLAALRAKKAGMDMVEILASAGYLICQFLSPKINKRTDRYGGSLENRMRFGLEIVAKVREAVGLNFCVGIRIAGNDFISGSHSNNDEVKIFAIALVNAGVDMINVTGGWHESSVPQITADLPPGGFAYLAREVRESVNNRIPVAASNRIHNPWLAEEIIVRGDADLICMGRPLLADHELPFKAQNNQEELIHYCISCNQGCFDAVSQLRSVKCAVNPRLGLEYKIPLRLSTVIKPKLIIVVGGGPAGAMAAITAARRGHKVMLLELTSCLGGQILWYANSIERYEFRSIPVWQMAELVKLGVEIHYNLQVDVDYLVKINPTTVIIATGSRPNFPDIPGIKLPHVIDAWAILQGKVIPRSQVVIIGGGAVGLATALNIVKRGVLTPEQVYFLTFFHAESVENIKKLAIRSSYKVTVLELLPKVGQGIGRSTRWVIINKLNRFGVDIKTNVLVKSIESSGVRIVIDGREDLILGDTVIIATGITLINRLVNQLISKGVNTLVVGDANGAGSIIESINQGYRVGLEV